MKRYYLAIGLIALAGMFWAWRDRAPEPAEVEWAPTIYPTPTPIVDEPLQPTKPPTILPAPAKWWPCAEIHSSRMDAEDAWLRKVLASTVDGDPLFGVAVWSMSAAECAARRERLAWMR